MKRLSWLVFYFFFLNQAHAAVIELNGSPYATANAPLPPSLHTNQEKMIVIDPHAHAWGAYNAHGKLIRWGIATAGAQWCRDSHESCRTKVGQFRIYSRGDESCVSYKYPVPDGGAPMPYCMYFNGGQALHGSNDIDFANISHGCVRLHEDDAKWLRYHFVEGPSGKNHYLGTRVVIRPY